MILQRYTFGSKSQRTTPCSRHVYVAYDIAKIYIWKQITTKGNEANRVCKLLMILQRYTFGSKSQQNLFAYLNYFVAYDIAKIYIWKQITTTMIIIVIQFVLLMILQRYTFGSKSQQNNVSCSNIRSCL